MKTSQVKVKHLLSCGQKYVDHDLRKKVRLGSGLSHGPSSNPKNLHESTEGTLNCIGGEMGVRTESE